MTPEINPKLLIKIAELADLMKRADKVEVVIIGNSVENQLINVVLTVKDHQMSISAKTHPGNERLTIGFMLKVYDAEDAEDRIDISWDVFDAAVTFSPSPHMELSATIREVTTIFDWIKHVA